MRRTHRGLLRRSAAPTTYSASCRIGHGIRPNVDQVPDPEQMLTTAQAAKVLGVSARTLARYVERGQLIPTVVLPSGHYRWLLSDIREQLRELRQRPTDDE